jgi:hypothetical protein
MGCPSSFNLIINHFSDPIFLTASLFGRIEILNQKICQPHFLRQKDGNKKKPVRSPQSGVFSEPLEFSLDAFAGGGV